jgi:hypothetical protein
MQLLNQTVDHRKKQRTEKKRKEKEKEKEKEKTKEMKTHGHFDQHLFNFETI